MQVDAIKKILWPAALPLLLVALLVAAMLLAPFFGEIRKVRSAQGPTIEEARQVLQRVSRARVAIQSQLTNSVYPLEEVLAKLAPPPPATPAVRIEPPLIILTNLASGAVPPPQPVAPPPPPEPVLAVTGIALSEMGRIVCVNNRIVAEGGMVEGFKVVKIEPRQVTFDDLKGRIRIVRIK